MNLTVAHITLLRLARLAVLGFMFLLSAGASAELPRLGPQDLRLVKAVRTGDEAEVRAAIAAGGRIKGPEYEVWANPLFVAVLFDRNALLPLLTVDDSAIDIAYFAAIAFAKPASFSSLEAIRPPSSEIVANGLRMFGRRFSSDMKAGLRAAILELTEEGTDAPTSLPWFRAAVPDHLTTPDAPELDIARRLRSLGSVLGPSGDDDPMSSALASGDVYFIDWLVAEGLVGMTADMNAKLFRSTVTNRFQAGFETMVRRGMRPSIDGANGRDLLSDAAKEGDGYFVTRLLELGAAVNPPLNSGPSATPLNAAASGGHLSVARQLIAAGALPNIVSPEGTWALREAARRGQVDLVKLLLESGADARTTDTAGNTALHGFTSPAEEPDPFVLFGKVQRMLTDGHRESARMLLQAGLPARTQNTEGVSILASLLSGGRQSTDFWTELVLLGAEIDESCYTAVVNSWDVPQARLNWFFNAAGGDPNHVLRKPADVSLVEFAASEYWLPTLESLFKLGARVPNDPAKQASMLGQMLTLHHPGSLAAAFARGMSPNLKLSADYTALESVISKKDVSIVRLFLDAGANVNMVGNSDTQGNVLHELVGRDVRRPGRVLSSEQMPSVTLLIERGLDLAKKDKYGRTVFDLANKSPTTAKFLTDAVAKAGSGIDAVHVAVRDGDLVALERLIGSGAGIETRDSLGRTPLTVALATGQVAIVRRLLRGGASIAATSTIPGIASDLSYATDPRFTSFFHPRLVADALIDVRTAPADELVRLRTAATFRPGPMVWRIACRNGCQGETEMTDSTRRPWDLSRSEREDSDGRTVVTAFIPYHTEDDVQGTGIGVDVIRRVIREGIWTIRGAWNIEGCTFNVTNPYCFPEANLEVTDLSGGTISVKGGDVDALLKEGESVLLDRSAGAITIGVNPIEGRSPRARMRLTYNLRPTIPFSPGVGLAQRMQTYRALAELKAEREVLLRTGERAALIRAKTLTATIRELSAKAVGENYALVLQQLFQTRAQDIVALDQRVLDLRAVLQANLSFPTGDLQLLIKRIEDLVVSDSSLSTIFNPVLSALKDAIAASRDGQAATGKAIENLFQDVDRVVFEYQGLALELAQFKSVEELESPGVLATAQRDQIRQRLRGVASPVRNSAFDGRGAQVRQALGFSQ